jgi:hypothetical protein
MKSPYALLPFQALLPGPDLSMVQRSPVSDLPDHRSLSGLKQKLLESHAWGGKNLTYPRKSGYTANYGIVGICQYTYAIDIPNKP